MSLIIGKIYLTNVAEMKDCLTNRKVYIPILPLRHKDPVFGVDRFHYHIDCRFKMSSIIKEYFGVKNYTTLVPVWEDYYDMSRFMFLGVTKMKKICVNLSTGFDMQKMFKPAYSTSKNIEKYWHWYKSMVGQTCAGKKCPHYGTEMIEKGKYLVCPMHNLVGSKRTKKIINYNKKFNAL